MRINQTRNLSRDTKEIYDTFGIKKITFKKTKSFAVPYRASTLHNGFKHPIRIPLFVDKPPANKYTLLINTDTTETPVGLGRRWTNKAGKECITYDKWVPNTLLTLVKHFANHNLPKPI